MLILLLACAAHTPPTPPPVVAPTPPPDPELRRVLDGLRIADLRYHAWFGRYVPCELGPRPVDALDASAVPVPATGGCAQVAWTTSDPVRGAWQVTVSGDGFTIDGWQDLDDDGVLAHWSADPDHAAAQVTPPEIR